MKVSLNWLKRYIDIKSEVEDLVELFTAIGIEVEGIESIGLKQQNSLIVGEIQKIDAHPNADKLAVCQVCVGENDIRQIVCGAKNFKLMDHVPVALPGTVLPGNIEIIESNLRGVASRGMMCSGRELGIGDDHSGLLILDKSTKIGTVLHDVIEVVNDTIFDLSVTSNRGDCLSYLGIARELGCKLNLPVNVPNVAVMKPAGKGLISNISIKSDDCQAYYGFCISGVKIGESPDWLVRDLGASGIKSINNVVDICNWVMLETGNPLHAFDVNKIKGHELVIRRASDGESIIGLDNKEHLLNNSVTVIADTKEPLVIAGIIGSIDAEIDDSSTDILIESACFDHAAIMRASRMLNVCTDSSYRFARMVDGTSCKHSGERAVELITQITGGRYEQYLPTKEFRQEKRSITITDKFVADKLGFVLDHKYICDVLSSLGFLVEDSPDGLKLTIPSFRQDIERPIDVVEECLRVYGTDKIPNIPVSINGVHRADHKAYTFSLNSRKTLSEHGFFECYNYSLTSDEMVHDFLGTDVLVKLQNPLSADQTSYRQSLLPGILGALKLNIKNGNSDDRFFEIGKVAAQVNGKINEYLAVSFIALEEPQARALNKHKIGFDYVKKICFEVLTHIANTVQVKLQPIGNSTLWQPEYSAEYSQLGRSGLDVKCGLLNKYSLKGFFDIKQNVWGAEMIIADSVFSRKSSVKTYRPFSQFPRITKDVSIVVNRDEQTGEVKHL
ncbi:MAG: phenylalanine--tRNA ligase subunit beta, partial [Opitutales bacterium]|nr:phenylalanine--tRNA ligase subunit beta [Opitutales bacterium]